MSAYVVSDFHINALVSFGALHQARYVSWDSKIVPIAGNEQRVAALLYATNVEAVNHRYHENEPTAGFVWLPMSTYGVELPKPLDILGACACYEYQAYELELDYELTPAFRIINVIRREAISALPGYADAAWDLNPPQQENRT